MIIRSKRNNKFIKIRSTDGRILNGICKRLRNVYITETPKYKDHIGIIPVILKPKQVHSVPESTKLGIHSISVFLKGNNRFPIVPMIKRKDMHKHIRIYARRKYNIVLSDVVDMRLITNKWGMDVYIVLLNYNKGINAKGYSWNNKCIIYEKCMDIPNIYSEMLLKNYKFLEDKITPGEIFAPEVKISYRDIIKELELWDTTIH